MADWVRDILRCPVGRHRLLDAVDRSGQPVLECAEDCGGTGLRRRYPVRDGIPVLLADEAELTDLTAGAEGADRATEPPS